jgi:hydroxymethylglutaryl-CoA synthase
MKHQEGSNNMVGIVGYSIYLPYFRIKSAEIAGSWNLDTKVSGEKTVPAHDETTLSLGFNATKNALDHAGINPEELGAVFFCTISGMIESSLAQDVAIGIGTKDDVTLVDLNGSPRSVTSAILLSMDAIKSGRIKNSLIVGSDILVGGPGSPITSAGSEYVLAAGAGALIIGENETIADIEGTTSVNSPVKTSWRSLSDPFPRLGDGRFIRDYGFIANVSKVGRRLMEKMKKKDYTHVLIQQPHATWIGRALEKLGIPKQELKQRFLGPGSIIGKFGDLGCGCLPVGLADILDVAKPKESILAISYGSGGSDALSVVVNENIESKRDKIVPVKSFFEKKQYVNYNTHLIYNKVVEKYREY